MWPKRALRSVCVEIAWRMTARGEPHLQPRTGGNSRTTVVSKLFIVFLLFLSATITVLRDRKTVIINAGPVGHYTNYVLAPYNKDRVPDIATEFIL